MFKLPVSVSKRVTKRANKVVFRMTLSFILLFTMLLSACNQGQPLPSAFNSTATSGVMDVIPVDTTETAPATASVTVTATLPASVPAAARSIPMNCQDAALIDSGAYRAENNTWGKGLLTGWSQCIGIEAASDGVLAGRWTWDWLQSGGNVKAYPEIIFGQKPGASSTTADLPNQINRLDEVLISYDITSTHTGSGNLAFDVWLTDTQDPSTWGVPPISHEIMIWLESYGGMRPGGTWIEQASIDDILYNVYVGENFGDGWAYIAFARVTSQVGAGNLNLVSFLDYMRAKSIVTGDEYVASVELGNEVVSGSGETVVYEYSVAVSLNASASIPVTKPTVTQAAEEEVPGVFMKKTFASQNGGSIPYQFLIPEVFREGQEYPLVVFLHGAGELGSDNSRQLAGFPMMLLDGHHKSDYAAFVVAPQCPANDAWSSFPDYPNSTRSPENPTNATRLAIELIEELLHTYNIDESRIYVIGFSLGGEGTFDIVSRRPDLFAAAVPICGIADVERAALMKDVPFWIFHGEKDDINPAQYSRMIVEALQQEGASPKYTEYKGAGHEVWTWAYSEPELFPWLFSQRKP